MPLQINLQFLYFRLHAILKLSISQLQYYVRTYIHTYIHAVRYRHNGTCVDYRLLLCMFPALVSACAPTGKCFTHLRMFTLPSSVIQCRICESTESLKCVTPVSKV